MRIFTPIGINNLALWPWPWSLTYLLEDLTLQRTFELWVLELIHFTWIRCGKAFLGYQHFYPVTTSKIDLFFKNINPSNNFWTVSARALIFHMDFLWDKAFPWAPTISTLWPLPWGLTYFLKNFSLAKNFWTVSARVYTFHMNISS